MIIAPALIEANALLRKDRLLTAGAALIAFLCWLLAAATPAYSHDYQQRFTIEHVTEFPSRSSVWSILNDGTSLPASYSSLGRWHQGKFPYSERQRWLAAAPPQAGIDPASIRSQEASNDGSERTLKLHIEAKGAERILLVAPSGTRVRSAGFPGYVRQFEDRDSAGRFTLSCTGRSCDGAELTITLGQAEPVTFTVVGSRNGLPQSAVPLTKARPQLARPQYVPDETITITHVVV